MNPSRMGNANALLAIILFSLLTVVFAFLAWQSNETYLEVLNGRDGGALKISSSNSLLKLRANIGTLERELSEMESKRKRLGEQYANISLQLSSLGVYKSGSTWLGDDAGAGVWTHARTGVESDQKILQIWDDSMADRDRHEFRSLNRGIDDSRSTVDNINDRIAREEEVFNSTRDRLITEQDDLAEKQNTLRRAHKTRFAELMTAKAKLETEIRDLLELSLRWVEELDSDGEILQVVSGEHVVINRGKSDRLQQGLRFEIFSTVKGTHTAKGLCEVVDISEHIATCRILQEYDSRRNPIAQGDQVGNPVYSTERPQSFYLAGEFEGFNTDDLARFIERAGGVVKRKLDPSVDFLVAGLRSDGEQDAAREYRVLAMHEHDLTRFLDTTFRPK